jgi:tetratricopeptide (TPR) repeat protein
VHKRYASTAVATTALVDLGNAYFQSGDCAAAIASYREFIRRADRSHPLYDQVLQSLGASHEASRSWESALEVYKRLVRDGSPVYRNQAELGLGRVYEALGNRLEAKSHYESYLQGNPMDPLSAWIQTKLSRWDLAADSEQQP